MDRADASASACASTGSTPRIPAFHLGPSLLTPNRNYDVPEFSTTRYKDWTPKVAAAYDLFGDGKTALKVNFGRVRPRTGAGRRRSRQPARLQRAAHVVRGRGSTTTATSFPTAI